MGAHRARVFVGSLFSVALLLAPLASTPVAASNYSGGTGSIGCAALNEADNRTHTFHNVDVESSTSTAIYWSRENNLDGSTVINPEYDATLGNHTDVVVRDQNYVDYCGKDWMQGSPDTSGTVGLTTCDLTAGAPCDQHTVRINLNYTEKASTDTSEKRNLACHEIGHTLGLQHRDAAGCMKQGLSTTYTDYTDHDRAHLTAEYPP